MKASRLLLYGIAGVIAGLLIENKALIHKMRVEAAARRLERKVKKTLS